MDNQLKNKFIGCLLGVGIGDALGAPAEGLTVSQIKDKYDVITDYIASGDLKKGEYTDDTSMTLGILEALVENGFFDINSIVDKFLMWFNANPKGIGNTTYNALYLIDQGYSFEDASQEVYSPLSAGNGAAMRVAPIPLFNYKNGLEKVVQDTIDSCLITHAHPESISGSVATSLTIYYNIHNGDKNKLTSFLLNEGRDYIQNMNILKAIESVDLVSEDELERTGYILDTIRTGLWIFMHTDSFEDSVLNAVNGGGDTDTLGAIVGSFSGSFYGFDSIPDKWIKGLKKSQNIMKLAERLYDISILDKLF
ncbi:MAG: ADP-ribosylglycohydrolase family protein [Spirochaetes bacterium]|nr:ADP-ribosylglycohydrolase family protein [Spirochaetota bacterium]